MVPATMHAAVAATQSGKKTLTVTYKEVPVPVPARDESLLRVLGCGICRTDLHIVDGELPAHMPELILGHQIVGEVVTTSSTALKPGDRVGVSWMGGVDGTCRFCRSGRENLCDHPVYTGYTRNGGYAEYVTARSDFLYPLHAGGEPADVAPLLCAGIIGFRSLRVAEVKPGSRVGLFGFGASARQAIQVLRHWNCEVYVATRGERNQEEARRLGAVWVGGAADRPPAPLEAAVTFAPAGQVVLAALRALDKGGILAINAIHLDEMPAFDYDSLLWQERQIRSVANMTRQDAKDFLEVTAQIGIRPEVKLFPLREARAALEAVRQESVSGSAVLVPGE